MNFTARSHFIVPYRACLLAAFVTLLAISAIHPPHPADFVWEHALTVAFLFLLIWLEITRQPLSNASYTLLFLFMLLHVLGAHYTYSEVPYDHWCEKLVGTSLSTMVGYTGMRNHFDRLVHALFGLLLVQPMAELVQRWLGLRGIGCLIVAAAFLCVLGMMYELLEWIYAAIMGEEAAKLYNGEQGDAFDAQKDMAWNTMGSVVGALGIGIVRTWKTHHKASV